jgi:hypothetical protein
MTTLGKSIVDSLLTEPSQWRQYDYVIRHKNGMAIWTANIPFLNLSIYEPFEMSLTWSDKWAVYRAVRKHNELALQNLWSK